MLFYFLVRQQKNTTPRLHSSLLTDTHEQGFSIFIKNKSGVA